MAVDPHRCCEAMRLKIVGDCGSVTGFDLTLERCEACGEYVMDFYWAGSSTSNVLPADLSERYRTLRDGVRNALARKADHEVDPAAT